MRANAGKGIRVVTAHDRLWRRGRHFRRDESGPARIDHQRVEMRNVHEVRHYRAPAFKAGDPAATLDPARLIG